MPAVPDSAAEHQRLRKARPIRTVARRWLSCVEFSKDLFSVKSFAPVERSESVSDLCLHFTKAFGTNPLRRFQESKRFLDDLTGGFVLTRPRLLLYKSRKIRGQFYADLRVLPAQISFLQCSSHSTLMRQSQSRHASNRSMHTPDKYTVRLDGFDATAWRCSPGPLEMEVLASRVTVSTSSFVSCMPPDSGRPQCWLRHHRD